MNYWLPDEAKGLVQDFTYNPAKRLCIHCHDYRCTDEDGACDSCAGRQPDPGVQRERARLACEKLRREMDSNPKVIAARAEAERLLARSRKRVPMPAFSKGR